MKAIRLHSHDIPGGLVYEDVPQPQPTSHEVLVRVYAAGVTPAELGWGATWQRNDGTDRTYPIPGHEFSGIVVHVGEEVNQVKVGDAVYGLIAFDRDGSDAEYTVALPSELAPKPPSLDYVQAAAIPIGALMAWQALFDQAHLSLGQRVLVHGAAGGVGTWFVQIARWAGAHVIGVDALEFEAFLIDLGCNQFIDFSRTRFEEVVHDVDVVIDLVGQDTVDRSWNVLKKGGKLVSLLKPPSVEDAAIHQVQATFFIVQANAAQLIRIGELIGAGHIRPIVSEILPLEQAHLAYTRRPARSRPGKLVLQVVDRL